VEFMEETMIQGVILLILFFDVIILMFMGVKAIELWKFSKNLNNKTDEII